MNETAHIVKNVLTSDWPNWLVLFIGCFLGWLPSWWQRKQDLKKQEEQEAKARKVQIYNDLIDGLKASQEILFSFRYSIFVIGTLAEHPSSPESNRMLMETVERLRETISMMIRLKTPFTGQREYSPRVLAIVTQYQNQMPDSVLSDWDNVNLIDSSERSKIVAEFEKIQSICSAMVSALEPVIAEECHPNSKKGKKDVGNKLHN